MMNFIEDVGITGHLTIVKKYKDGEEEVVFDDHNIIVSGMGVGLSYLFTGSGSNSILDYQIDRFQLGVSAKPNSELEVSSTYELSSPLSLPDYGTAGNTYIEVASQIKVDTVATGIPFALIPPNKVTRINETSVRYTLVVDEEMANGLVNGADKEYLNEVGLLMKNPTGATNTNQSILVAYRNFSDIYKTNDFSLIFRWTLNF